MDKDKLIQRLAMQVAEYNLTNIQLKIRIEELEKEIGELSEKLWDSLPADPPEAQEKRKREKQKEHDIVNADRKIDTRTLDGKTQTIEGMSVRECSCGWGFEGGKKEEADKAEAAHLFKVGAKG